MRTKRLVIRCAGQRRSPPTTVSWQPGARFLLCSSVSLLDRVAIDIDHSGSEKLQPDPWVIRQEVGRSVATATLQATGPMQMDLAHSTESFSALKQALSRARGASFRRMSRRVSGGSASR